ncbi:cytochrome-c oxidase, cbb3-type subunit I [Verrucomicrobiaceae bacterium N1E253]|uniref:cytochrome-c oxidase n=1 Tax=Oceaniferula marina TaxID=2748318 RepID=A0A851GHQ4_9BACT|nr:cytochrome-c oxidase, cbb3-type subunit I [Oceaniferula marina]NWK56729.1 cytochrome-c oxidase, cbb3-type subunit I [Oceaniferula marina]
MNTPSNAATTTIVYDDKTVRHFLTASVIFGIVGMLVGVIAAFQLNFWQMNGKFLEWLTFGYFKTEGVDLITFGRLRPLHTNAVIFAFVGNMMFAGVYYSTQRLCKCRTASDLLSKIHFWGWQAIIVSAVITLPAGFTRGKEYAELIWPINIAVALIWVVFAVNFFWTLAKRNEPSLYVALWFYIATILTVAMLYIVNHLSIPTSLTHSYPVFAGVQDGLVQWWYGHNAVAFFLTTPILGIMYYFMPKAAERPVYSYRLSIIHFWALVFIYIWAGPHHLLNTALPEWLQQLGMLFSLMLWAPSWGGMLNGLLTLRGAWDKLRTDHVIKFFVVAITFYGMATFEGPLLAIKSVNALSHYTDWTVGHVHSGTLGWNGFMAAGMFYWLAPRLWKNNKGPNGESVLWSNSWANMHFWLGTVGILLYISSMWASGIMEGLMASATNEAGTLLKYPNFVQIIQSKHILLLFRGIGGGFYLIGFIMCGINLWKTARMGKATEVSVEVPVARDPETDSIGAFRMLFRNEPLTYIFWILVFLLLWIFLPKGMDIGAFAMIVVLSLQTIWIFRKDTNSWVKLYDSLEKNWVPFTILVFFAAAIGGAAQIIPTVIAQKGEYVDERVQKLYTPLELAGRDIYIAEGCYNCHSQMIRMLPGDIMRYGDYSRIGESIYDHPFQWSSKRTGPDLAREGGPRDKDGNYKPIRSDGWHYNHMMDPRETSEGSIMPAYPWLAEKETDIDALPKKISIQVNWLGVPYEAMTAHEIKDKAYKQGLDIAKGLVASGVLLPEDLDSMDSEAKIAEELSKRQIVALIAYLQKLGQYDLVDPSQKKATPALVDPDRKHPNIAPQTEPSADDSE